MPVFSCFTGFGFLEFSSAPSECEKIYRSLLSSYRDPNSGLQTIDTSIGTHKEAVIYGWANAIGAAMVTLRRAANELRPETSYQLLEAHEERFGMAPAATDSVADRQAALAAKQKAARGPRHEAVMEALGAILGDDLVAYRPISVAEAEAYPTTLEDAAAQAIFRRPDAVAKSIRLLTAVARNAAPVTCDTYFASVGLSTLSIPGTGSISARAQSFTGDGNRILYVRLYLSPFGAPTGNITVAICAHSGTFGTSSVPTGAALAASDPVDAATLGASPAWVDFAFTGANQITLAEGTKYTLVIDYPGAGPDTVDVWGNLAGTHDGNASNFNGAWNAEAATDLAFYVLTHQQLITEVSYENWNTHATEIKIVKGDVLCIDPGNWGLVEKVTVLDGDGEGEERKFSAKFVNPHSAGVYATDGPTPLWATSKRHVFVVVSPTAAIDAVKVARVDELFRRLMRAPTTWAIVRETTEGSGTIGPFAIGSTLGSPLGAVPLESITL